MASNCSPAKGGNATRHKSVSAGWSDATSLVTLALYPACAPQCVDFHNAGTAEQNAVFVTQSGDTVTIAIAPGATYPAEGPVATLSTSGANVSAVAMWYNTSGIPNNAA